MADPREWSPGTAGIDTRAHDSQIALHGLTASGAIGSGDQRQKDAESRHSATRAAQQQVWAYRRMIGELAHAVQFYENCFSRIRLTVAIEEDDGSRRPAFDEAGVAQAKGADEALQVLKALRSPIGGQSQLMRAIGGCLGAVGEGHLVGTENQAMPSGKAWEFFSPSEFFQPTTSWVSDADVVDYQRIRNPGAQPEIIKSNEAVVARIWQPDPEFSRLAWAPALGVLDIFEELVLLTREVAGAVRSRLALGGVLLVADDIEFQPDPNAPAMAAGADPLTHNFIHVASTAIKDKASAAGVVPIIMRVPANRVSDTPDQNGRQGFRLIEFKREWDATAADKRDECVRRFAQSIDLPVEIVLGHMSTTFCADDETEVLTVDGWRTHDALHEGDLVLALDHETGVSRWEPVVAVNRFAVEAEPMLHIDRKAHSSMTTAAHRWPVILKDRGIRTWRTSAGQTAGPLAAGLNTNCRVPTAAPCADTPTDPKWSDEFVELVAWFYTEGSIDKRGWVEGGQAVISQSEGVNAGYAARIRNTLHRLVGPPVATLRGQRTTRAWREYHDQNRPMARFYLSRGLTADLEVVAPDRIVTAEFVRSLTASQLELFLAVSGMADGWTTNGGTRMFGQANPAAVDGYELAVILSGRTPSRWTRRMGSGPYADHEMHYCSMTDRTQVQPISSHSRQPGGANGGVAEWVEYTGTVWCPTTPSGTWLARRRGRVFFTGNSNAAQISADMYRSYVEPKVIIATDGLTTGYLRLMLPGTPFVIHPDETDLVVRPDQSKDYIEGYKLWQISGASLRAKLGATEADKPDDDEIMRRIVIEKAIKAAPPAFGGDQSSDVTPTNDGALDGEDPAIAAAAESIVAGAMEVEIRRVRQRVGARLRSKCSGKAALSSILKNVKDEEVAATLGPRTVASLMTEDELLGREFAILETWAAEVAGPDVARRAAERARVETMKRLYSPAGR